MRNRIRDLRVDNDITQQQVAEAIRITQRKYSYIERGVQDPGIDILTALAKFYKTSVDYLLGLTDVREPYPPGRRRQ